MTCNTPVYEIKFNLTQPPNHITLHHFNRITKLYVSGIKHVYGIMLFLKELKYHTLHEWN